MNQTVAPNMLDEVSDGMATLSRVVGRLIYLSHERYDFVHVVRLPTTDPGSPEEGSLTLRTRVVRYLLGTLDLVIRYLLQGPV